MIRCTIFHRVVQTLVAMMALGCACAMAYEIDTHARMTKVAYDQSGLNKNIEIRRAMGLLKSRKSSV